MANYSLKIARKQSSSALSNVPITITTATGEYIIENGKTIEISLPEGKNELKFFCMNQQGGPADRKITFDLCADSIMEISYSAFILQIEKLPVPIQTPKSPASINKNKFEKFWNNYKMLFLITAILFVVSFVACAIINIGFIAVLIVLVFFAIIAIAVVGPDLKEKHDKPKISEYFNGEGKKDIAKIKEEISRVTTNGIPSNFSDNMYDYAKALLNKLRSGYETLIKRSLHQNGYTDYFELDKIGTIYYSSKKALIYNNIFLSVSPCICFGKIMYRYKNPRGENIDMSLDNLIDFYKKYAATDSYISLAWANVDIQDLHWHVVYPSSSGYKLADIGAGAVLGGLLLGPVGALAGGMSSNNSSKKSEKDETAIVFGGKGIGYHTIAKGEYECERVFEKLNKYLPKNRTKDTYRKTV